MDSLYDFYHGSCTRFAQYKFFSDGMTYGEVLRHVHGCAAFLQSKGYGRGKTIALLSQNSPEMCIAFMAITSCGARVLPLDPNLDRKNYSAMLKKAGADAIFTTGEFAKMFRGFTVFPLAQGMPRSRTVSFRKTAVKPNDTAALFFTSGTTGDPKIVQLTHANIMKTAAATAGFFRTSPGDMMLCLLPLFHAYGLIASFMAPMAHGSSICIQPSLRGPDIMKSLAGNPVTIFPAVPLLWEMIMEGIISKARSGPAAKYRIFMFCLEYGRLLRLMGLGFIPGAVFRPVKKAFGEKIRLLISGGAPMKTQYEGYYRSMGFTMVQGYGLSETTGPVLISPDRGNVTGSVGVPVNGNEVKLSGTDSEGTGEILIRGDAVMPGYYKNPEADKEVFDPEGFFRTGDLGRLDKKGNLFITGRMKNVIVLPSGKNVYPEELENYYNRSEAISEIAVFSREKNSSESVFAVIVPAVKNNTCYAVISDEISRMNHGQPAYKIISGFAISFDPLPRNSTRKILYDVIRERLEKGLYAAGEGMHTVPVAELIAQGPLETMVIDLLKARFGRKKLFANETLAGMGVDSLGLVDLATHLEEKLGVSPDMDRLKSLNTLAELVAYISTAEPSAAGSLEDRIFTGAPGAKPYRFFNPVLALTLDIMSLVFKFFWRLDTSGIEGISLDGTIISPNHTSYFDIVLVACAIPRRYRKKLYVQGTADFSFLRLVFPLIPVIWVDEHNTVDVLSKSAAMLRQGRSLIIFPEGGRSADGRMMQFRPGAAYLAKHLGRDIIPVSINGAFDVWPRTRLIPRFNRRLRISINKGEAVRPGDYKDPEAMINEVKKRIREISTDINSTGWQS